MHAVAGLGTVTPRLRPTLRLALVLSFFVWLFVRPLRDGVSMWVPFAATAGVELHFFASGALERARRRAQAGLAGGGLAGRAEAGGDGGERDGRDWIEPRARGDLGPTWRLEAESYVVVDDPLAGDLEDVGPDAGWRPPDALDTGWTGGAAAGRRAAWAVEAAGAAFVGAWLFVGAMRHVPAVLALAAAALVLASVILRLVAEAGLPARRRRPLATALRRTAALAVLGVVVFLLARPSGWEALPRAERAQAQALFSREAGRIAGKRVTVACDTAGTHTGVLADADGAAVVGGTQAWLAAGICSTLAKLALHGRHDSFDATSWAILVLAHEAWHLRGSGDEGVTDCYAMQSGVGLGRRLGLSPGEAEHMMRYRWQESVAEFSLGRAQYMLPRGCESGGRYDLHPGASRFP